MHIVFNAYITNLGNTGGCRTIVKSAETLRELGHKVDIVARKNRYTWSKVKTIKSIPKCDACVAVSVLDVDNTRHAKAKHKAFYLRGNETWFKTEKEIAKKVKSIPTIANSSWLARKYKTRRCWSGFDIHEQTLGLSKDRLSRVGFLYNMGHNSKNSGMYLDIADDLPGIEFRTLSASKAPASIEGVVSPSEKKKKLFYESVGMWWAPTDSEGMHQPPAEANLCGALVICNRKESNGMGDYATDETAMRYDTVEEAIDCIKNPDYSKVGEMQTLLKQKIGDREFNMKLFVKLLEES